MSPSISGALAPGAGGGPGAASRFREASRRHDRGSGSYPADPGPSEEEPPQMAEPGHRGHGPRGLLRTGGGGEGAQLFRELRRQVTGKKGGWWRATVTALLGAEVPEATRGRGGWTGAGIRRGGGEAVGGPGHHQGQGLPPGLAPGSRPSQRPHTGLKTRRRLRRPKVAGALAAGLPTPSSI